MTPEQARETAMMIVLRVEDVAGEKLSTVHAGELFDRIAAALVEAGPPDYAAFEAGWNAGFQEALQPDRFPWQNRCEVVYRELFPEGNGPAAATAGEWQDIETAPKGRKLIIGYFNPSGKWRTITGCYWLDGTLESDTDESGFAPEGWYEATEAYEYLMPCDQEPTHWMPIPSPPRKLVEQEREVEYE